MKPTATLAICALNEGPNISHLLQSILGQDISLFTLEQILIISDGSTDDTVEKIKKFNDPRIILKDYSERKGKSFRLNEIYGGVKSDFVIQPDADVILGDKKALDHLIEPMIKNTKIGMTGGNPHPMKPETYIEKAIYVTAEAYVYIRESIRGGNNIYTATGRLIALRKEVFADIHVPAETISNDHFVYFCTLKAGFSFAYAPGALVYFRLPQVLKDHVKQETRFSSAEYFMKRYFGDDIVNREYHIPLHMFLKAALMQFFKHPVYAIIIFFINLYCKIGAFIGRNHTNALWDVVTSTKHLTNKPIL